jgi:hypothetical protein
MFDRLRELNYDLRYTSHAGSILQHEFPGASQEIEDALADLDIPIESLVGSGGGVATVTQYIRREFDARGWTKENFHITQTVNGVESVADSHEVDHVKKFPNGCLLLEIEWNNKDPFYDRDLSNFRALHQASAASVGLIVTRGSSLQAQAVTLLTEYFRRNSITDFSQLQKLGMKRATQRQQTRLQHERIRGSDPFEALARVFVADKYGAATTHWGKLMDRIDRGVGRPCPLVLIGIPAGVVSS